MKLNEIHSTPTLDAYPLLKKYFDTTGNITFNSEGHVSCSGHVTYKTKDYNKLPITFLHVSGNFDCSESDLTTLEGCPRSVGGSFVCYRNKITSLEGGPEQVNKSYWCHNNLLTTLKGVPENHPCRQIYLTYSTILPLMRTLFADDIVFRNEFDNDQQILVVLNKYAGRGKAGMMACSSELLTLGKKLGVDLRQNARW